jgi:hypothetical protein
VHALELLSNLLSDRKFQDSNYCNRRKLERLQYPSPLMSDHGIREASFSDRTININAIICESWVLQTIVLHVLVAIFTVLARVAYRPNAYTITYVKLLDIVTNSRDNTYNLMPKIAGQNRQVQKLLIIIITTRIIYANHLIPTIIDSRMNFCSLKKTQAAWMLMRGTLREMSKI